MYRSKIWRTRLDATTNWAGVTIGIARSMAFSAAADAPDVDEVLDPISKSQSDAEERHADYVRQLEAVEASINNCREFLDDHGDDPEVKAVLKRDRAGRVDGGAGALAQRGSPDPAPVLVRSADRAAAPPVLDRRSCGDRALRRFPRTVQPRDAPVISALVRAGALPAWPAL